VDERLEAVGFLIGGEHADHGAHGVTDEHHVRHIERPADLQDVAGVAVECLGSSHANC
jgi:hypothetical protein